MLAFVLSNFAASVIGLFLGYLLGRMGREVHEVHEAVTDDARQARSKGPHMSTKKQDLDERPFWQRRWRRFLGPILFSLGVAVAVQGVYVTVENDRQNDCFRRALAIRGQLQQQDNVLLTDMLRAVIDRSATDAERAEALRFFLQERGRIEKERQEHPLDQETCRD